MSLVLNSCCARAAECLFITASLAISTIGRHSNGMSKMFVVIVCMNGKYCSAAKISTSESSLKFEVGPMLTEY